MRLCQHVDEAGLIKRASQLASHTRPGDIWLLYGEMGMGKTTFARGFIQHCAKNPTLSVTSPTFSLIQRYETPLCPIWHADLHRLKHKAELPELGLDLAATEGILLVEWPEIALGYLPEPLISIKLSDSPEGRQLDMLFPPSIAQRFEPLA